MEIVFTRVSEARVVVTVERDDGAVLETRSPRAAHRLPHDLIHYVVERELGLGDGFWGKVASGVMFGNFQLLHRPTKRRAPRARMKSDEKGGLEAEVLVGVFDDIWEGTAEREWGSVRAFLKGRVVASNAVAGRGA